MPAPRTAQREGAGLRVLISSSQAPFLRGGAELLAEGLGAALQRAGHAVERLQLPFNYSDPAGLARLMDWCESADLRAPNGQAVDRLIGLQWPGYGLAHPQAVLWLLHQHRAAHELFDPAQASPAEAAWAEAVRAYDARVLPRVGRRFTISRRVAARLQASTGLEAQVLYHPPPGAARLAALAGREAWDYVVFPSRLETLKRQDLLIEAAARLRCPLKVLIAGTGGQGPRLAARVEALGLQDRVRLVGGFSEAEKLAFYAHALGVVFTPRDEDLGYVTLEAMLAGKPVITCSDSGGPLEFVQAGETGWVVAPEPEALAEALEALWADRARARAMGEAGRARLAALHLSWDTVVETLCA